MQEIIINDYLLTEVLKLSKVHFNGSLNSMLKYFENIENEAVDNEIDINLIRYCISLQNNLNENLTDLFLTPSDLDEINKYLKMKSNLEKIISNNNLESDIAKMILYDDESHIKNLIKHKEKGLPYIKTILSSSEFYNKFSPCFGKTPIKALKVIEGLKNIKALNYAIHGIEFGDFEYENTLIKTINSFGEDGLYHLKNIIISKPITQINEQAAFLLSSLDVSSKIAQEIFDFLNKEILINNEYFSKYLILCCCKLEHKNINKIDSLINLNEISKQIKDNLIYIKDIIIRRFT